MKIKDKNTLTQPFEEAGLPMRDMTRSLPMALLMAREAVMASFRAMLSVHNLTEQQWRILRVLAEVTEAEVLELAKKCFILQPSVSRILKNLEERKLINRRTSEIDRRRFYISLTEKGAALFKAVAPQGEKLYHEIDEAFGQDKVDNLLEMLTEIHSVLTKKS
jgi:homoprotocatechuate degradation regulator HpaR